MHFPDVNPVGFSVSSTGQSAQAQLLAASPNVDTIVPLLPHLSSSASSKL